ncbi:MAG: GWxTD domain-containing protein [Acidobacteria bacterium]|nr:GWxTD domain-containing protein [Acidobacteriota bacterium]
MKTKRWWILALAAAFGLCLAAPPESKAAKADKRKLNKEEQPRHYKKWLEEDVVYIITDEERAIFGKLTTDDERDTFIEQFWVRRNPNPLVSGNEFKNEHYRRIAYANDHFQSGKPGWKTDRGKIYILFGKPNLIESNPSGHVYNRDLNQGGGHTTTFPYEVWTYNHIEGIGDNISIEFVDSTLTNEYRMAISPEEKDALLYASGAGNTLLETLGYETREDRIRNMGIKNVSGSSMFRWGELNKTFARYQQFFQLRRPPEIQFKDLQQMVSTRMGSATLPAECSWFFVQLSPNRFMVPVTLAIPKSALQYKEARAGGVHQAKVELYGLVQSLSGRIVYEFEDTIVQELSAEQVGNNRVLAAPALYQRCIPMVPGRFRMSIVLKDAHSGNTAVLEKALALPSAPENGLCTSALVLADRVSPAGPGETLTDPFILEGNLKLYPNLGKVRNGTSIAGYLEVYNLGVDGATLKPQWELDVKVFRGDEPVELPPDSVSQVYPILRGNKLVLFWMQSIRLDRTGEYQVKARVTDKITRATAEAVSPVRIY